MGDSIRRSKTIIEVDAGSIARFAACFHSGVHILRAPPLDLSRDHATKTARAFGENAVRFRFYARNHRVLSDDKYLPSFLVRGEVEGTIFHAQVATDVDGSNVRVVTMYRPDIGEWVQEFRSRRKNL